MEVQVYSVIFPSMSLQPYYWPPVRFQNPKCSDEYTSNKPALWNKQTPSKCMQWQTSHLTIFLWQPSEPQTQHNARLPLLHRR